jgi:hypothetical protein
MREMRPAGFGPAEQLASASISVQRGINKPDCGSFNEGHKALLYFAPCNSHMVFDVFTAQSSIWKRIPEVSLQCVTFISCDMFAKNPVPKSS